MLKRDLSSRRASRVSRPAMLGIGAIAIALLASGCQPLTQHGIETGYLPEGVTENAQLVERLWIGSWIAALAVGLLVWGLILWCVIAYRKRKNDDGTLPLQLQYNVPLEILYTVVPIFMVATLFYFSANYASKLQDVSKKPDLTVGVVGKQWSWDFNYVEPDTYESGTQAELTGVPGVEEQLPALYIPVGKRVQFDLTSRDVSHTFWVPAFLQKLDLLPSRVNRFQVVPTKIGVFAGKCAELCGSYHSQMLFNVHVVSQADFDKHMAALKAKGNKGQLPNSLNREKILPQDQSKLPEGDN